MLLYYLQARPDTIKIFITLNSKSIKIGVWCDSKPNNKDPTSVFTFLVTQQLHSITSPFEYQVIRLCLLIFKLALGWI